MVTRLICYTYKTLVMVGSSKIAPCSMSRPCVSLRPKLMFLFPVYHFATTKLRYSWGLCYLSWLVVTKARFVNFPIMDVSAFAKWSVVLFNHFHSVIDCYTVLAWMHKDCQWGMRHGFQLVSTTLLWLDGLNIDWDCPVPHCIMGSRDQWDFWPFSRPQWPSLFPALTAGKCLPLGLCKGTVEESILVITPLLCHYT